MKTNFLPEISAVRDGNTEGCLFKADILPGDVYDTVVITAQANTGGYTRVSDMLTTSEGIADQHVAVYQKPSGTSMNVSVAEYGGQGIIFPDYGGWID